MRSPEASVSYVLCFPAVTLNSQGSLEPGVREHWNTNLKYDM